MKFVAKMLSICLLLFGFMSRFVKGHLVLNVNHFFFSSVFFFLINDMPFPFSFRINLEKLYIFCSISSVFSVFTTNPNQYETYVAKVQYKIIFLIHLLII